MFQLTSRGFTDILQSPPQTAVMSHGTEMARRYLTVCLFALSAPPPPLDDWVGLQNSPTVVFHVEIFRSQVEGFSSFMYIFVRGVGREGKMLF